MNRTARILARTRIAGSLSTQKSRPAVADSVAETAACIYVSGTSGLKWRLLKDRPDPVFKYRSKRRACSSVANVTKDKRPGSMINGEAARPVVVPLEACVHVARETGVVVSGTGDTAGDVNDAFFVFHA